MSTLSVGAGIPPRPPATRLHEVVAAARDSGVSALWCIDHFTSFVPHSVWDADFSPFASPANSPDEIFEFQTMLGYAAGIAGDMRLGVGVTEAIRRHPVLIAQTFLTLSHLTSSTVMIGIGAGERENTEPFGYRFERPVGRLEEALRLLRICLQSVGPFNFEGEFFNLDKAVLDLAPGPGGPPEIWVAADGPRTLRLAGTYGDGWYPTHPMSPHEYSRQTGSRNRRRSCCRSQSRGCDAWAADVRGGCAVTRGGESTPRRQAGSLDGLGATSLHVGGAWRASPVGARLQGNRRLHPAAP